MTDLNSKILELAGDIRKFELSLFWQRSLFFWGFIAVSFITYANLKAEGKEIRFAIVCIGFIYSLGWALVNRGSKYWQEAWEQKVQSVELQVLGRRLFTHREPVLPNFWLWRARRYSVSKLTIALSDFTVLVWIYLGIYTATDWASLLGPWLIPTMAVSTFAYAVMMLIGGRRRIWPSISN